MTYKKFALLICVFSFSMNQSFCDQPKPTAQTAKQKAEDKKSGPQEVYEEVNDPLEPLNRIIYAFNSVLDFVAIRPAAEIYRALTNEPIRQGVTNFLDNLFSPVVLVNNILQGHPEEAVITFLRFATNTIIGGLGIADVAHEFGMPRFDTTFNQTLSRWGVDTGPYFVIPVLGSSSFRGIVGIIGDYYADPLVWILNNRAHRNNHQWLTYRTGMDMINLREKYIEAVDDIVKSSPDTYVTFRSIYFQKQNYLKQKN